MDLSDIPLTHRRDRIEVSAGIANECAASSDRCRAPRIEATGGIPAMAGASIQMGAAQVENLSEPNLHQKGMQMHEAQELALAEWIRLPTERPGRVSPIKSIL